jgi:hypothetical protein
VDALPLPSIDSAAGTGSPSLGVTTATFFGVATGVGYHRAMRMRLGVAALLLAGIVPAARADVTVTIDPGAGTRFAQQAGIDLSQVEQQLRQELERLFQTYRLKDYLRSFHDAQSFTTRGLGVDYGSTIGLVEIGIAANLAVNGNKALVEGDSRTQPVAGVAPNITAMAGLNLGFLGLRPVTLFGNYFTKKGNYREFAAQLDNYGAHLQVKFFTPRKETLWNAFFQWGGLAFTSGFDHARMRLSLGQTFARKVPISGAGQDVGQIAVDSQGTFTIDSQSWSVPIEVTTNARFLYVLSAYVGAGFDFQFGGGSDLDVDLSGRLTGLVPSQNLTLDLGTARVTAKETAEPSKGQVRGILGLQANLWFLKLFTQLNVVPNPFVASVAVGARLVY